MHVLTKMHNNHIFQRKWWLQQTAMEGCCYLSGWALLSLTCRGASLLLFLPCEWLPLVVELDVVVVATKNRRGTIMPAEKQNEEDIKFRARHVCTSQDSWEHGLWIISPFTEYKSYWLIWGIFLDLWLLLSGMCPSVQSSWRHNGTTHSHPVIKPTAVPNTSTWGHNSAMYE